MTNNPDKLSPHMRYTLDAIKRGTIVKRIPKYPNFALRTDTNANVSRTVQALRLRGLIELNVTTQTYRCTEKGRNA